MDEMKIYCRMNGNDVSELQSLNTVVDKLTYYLLLSAKYRLMWLLRQFEEVYKESGGFIVIVLDDIESEPRLEAYNFEGLLKDYLNLAIPGIKFI